MRHARQISRSCDPARGLTRATSMNAIGLGRTGGRLLDRYRRSSTAASPNEQLVVARFDELIASAERPQLFPHDCLRDGERASCDTLAG